MNIATILFTYNRSKHTKMVLEALAENTILPNKLFIFQDGIKASTDVNEWEKVSNIISSISWCNTEIFISETNNGLAQSIKSGVNYVFQFYDAIIVLEDDCVPHPQFMEYMIKALEKYEKSKEVYHIGASSEPAYVEDNGTDAYFLGRINSCGWGTWKDRWILFKEDYTMLGKIKADSIINKHFELWGVDLEAHLLGNIYGQNDSWAVFWALIVIMNHGYCMSPYESLINNIGFDGTGVHSGVAENTLRLRSREKLSPINLPDNIEWVKNYARSFAYYYPWINPAIKNEYYKNVALDLLELQKKKATIANYLINKNIYNIIIWGKGRICDYIIENINNQISIDAIVETDPIMKDYDGIPIISWRDIPQNISLIILIPGYDIKKMHNMIESEELINKIVPVDQLIKYILS